MGLDIMYVKPDFNTKFFIHNSFHNQSDNPAVGTSHTSISDVPLLVGDLLGLFDPTSLGVKMGEPYMNVQLYANVSTQYLKFLQKGTRNGVLASNVTTPTFVPSNATGPGQVVSGRWEVHVAPAAR